MSNSNSLSPLLKLAVAGVAILGCLGAGMWLAPRAAVNEAAHRNWDYVQRAKLQSDQTGETQLLTVGTDGVAHFFTMVSLSEAEQDNSTTSSVTAALQAGTQQDAVRAIVAAQQIPEVKLVETGDALPQQITPTLSEGLKADLLRGDANFYHLYMLDCCVEDGDVIEVQLDGRPFAVVPITNAGATLSIPLAAGRVTSLAIRGVRDGEGGITVGFLTGDGQSFLGRLEVDELVPLGVIGK